MVAFNKYSAASNGIVGLILDSRARDRMATEFAKAVAVPFVIKRKKKPSHTKGAS